MQRIRVAALVLILQALAAPCFAQLFKAQPSQNSQTEQGQTLRDRTRKRLDTMRTRVQDLRTRVGQGDTKTPQSASPGSAPAQQTDEPTPPQPLTTLRPDPRPMPPSPITPSAVIPASGFIPIPPKHVALKNSHVLLVPPAGFVESEHYVGFEQPSTGASVVVNEIPGPYHLIASSSSKDFAQQGMTIKEEKAVEVAGRKGVLIAATQPERGTPCYKWILLFGDDQQTVSIVANFPEEHTKNLADSTRACLLSAQLAGN